MTCIDPPELDPIQLSMFLDGEANDNIVNHLRHCAYCREHANRLGSTQQSLKALLHRRSCPRPEQLRDYAWDLLPTEEVAIVAHHLSRCPHCNHELLNNYLEERSPLEAIWLPASALLNRVKVFIATLIPAAPLRPAYREHQGGATQIETKLYQASDNVFVGIMIEEDDNHSGHKILAGTVSGINTEGLQLDLWLTNQLMRTLTLDAGGDFQISDLAPQTYELILTGPELKIHIPKLPVGIENNTSDTSSADSSAPRSA